MAVRGPQAAAPHPTRTPPVGAAGTDWPDASLSFRLTLTGILIDNDHDIAPAALLLPISRGMFWRENTLQVDLIYLFAVLGSIHSFLVRLSSFHIVIPTPPLPGRCCCSYCCLCLATYYAAAAAASQGVAFVRVNTAVTDAALAPSFTVMNLCNHMKPSTRKQYSLLFLQNSNEEHNNYNNNTQ